MRRLEYWLTLVVGVIAAGTWVSQTVTAITADKELSAKGIFVWLAAATAGVAIGVLVGMLTSGVRARLEARQMARGGPDSVWDMSRYSLLMGILFLGLGTGPIFLPEPQSLWGWVSPAGLALVAGLNFGVVFVLRDERRLPIPPPVPHPAAPPFPAQPFYPPPPGYPPPPDYRPNPSGWQPRAPRTH